MTTTNIDESSWIAGPLPGNMPATIAAAIDDIEERNGDDRYRYFLTGSLGAMLNLSLQQMRDLAKSAEAWGGAEVTLYAWDAKPWLTVSHRPHGAGIKIERFDA